MAALPLDPRLARMLVEGSRLGCLREVLVIVAALAIVDVREYPLEEREKATAAHSRFVDPQSDFSALLGLWVYLDDQAKASVRQRVPPDVPAGVPELPADPGMAGPARAAPADRPRAGHGRRHANPAGRRRQPARATDSRRGDPTAAGRHQRRRTGQGGRGSLAVEVDNEKVHTALLAGLLSHIGLRQRGRPGVPGHPGQSRS